MITNDRRLGPGAYLDGADLRGMDLHGMNLCSANLSWAILTEANLSYADLHCARLNYADLRFADLRGANLTNADLEGAHLHGAYLPNYQVCPPSGAFLAYKKLRFGRIATLEIPAEAERTSCLTSRKCRASEVRVISITKHGKTFTEGKSIRDYGLIYTVGEIVRPTHAFNSDIRTSCASGIHFFMTREEAADY